jgi:N-acetylglucosaminyl-diphospho-decaprenol L-rhamnosyltransferase
MDPTLYIPHMNGTGRLRRALASLQGQTVPCRIVVVDNASADDSVAMVRREFPQVEVVQMEHNRGFGVALNRAIDTVAGDPLIILNNDTQCEPDFVEGMLAGADGVEMAAGILVQDERPGLIDSAGIMAEAQTLMAFDYLRGEPVETTEHVAPPFGPSGGAALYRREAFERVGGFDERIFLYYEDFELALRMRAAGARCGLATGARVRHVGSATLGNRSGEKYALTGWSRGYILRRYGVLRKPSNALRTIGAELAVCAGQVFLDRSAKGIVGRAKGWRAARGLEHRRLPEHGLVSFPTSSGLLRRARRRGWGKSAPRDAERLNSR